MVTCYHIFLSIANDFQINICFPVFLSSTNNLYRSKCLTVFQSNAHNFPTQLAGSEEFVD